MNLATVGAIGGLVIVVVAMITLVVQLRDRAAKLRKEREDMIRAARKQGFRDRDTEFSQLRASHEAQTALLRSQRDDARRDRDEATRRADEYERRYNDLVERRG